MSSSQNDPNDYREYEAEQENAERREKLRERLGEAPTHHTWKCVKNDIGIYVVIDHEGQAVALSHRKIVAVRNALRVAAKRRIAVQVTEDETQ